MNEPTTSKEQLGVILSPKNLLKAVGASFPIASSGVEIYNQLEGHKLKKRMDSLEEQQQLAAKISTLEAVNHSPPVPLHDWSIATGEFLRRTVDIAVAYDGIFEDPEKAGRDLIQPVAHACLIGNHEILSCGSAFDLASEVARHKKGRVVILAGLAWYDFDQEPVQNAVGLRIHRLKDRDDKKWEIMKSYFKDDSVNNLDMALSASVLTHRVSVWQGQEFGFVHSGEASGMMSVVHSFSKLQFEASNVSHFKHPHEDGLKVAVSGVLPSRFTRVGSPVFTREGELIGILSDSESYESDAGRRAVIRTLLGLPRYTNFTKKQPAKGDA